MHWLGLAWRRSIVAVSVFGVVLSAACGSTNKSSSFDEGDASTEGGTNDGAVDDALVIADSGRDAGPSDGSIFNDGAPDVEGGSCIRGDAGAPPYPQKCASATTNEC